MIYWIKNYFTDLNAHIEALYEVIMTALFSLGPLYINYFAESAKHEESSFTALNALVGRGQLYLLAYALFGTIFWLSFLKGDKPRHGARALLGAIATIIILPVVGFLGIDPTFSTILNHKIVHFSYIAYALLLFIHYLLIFYMNVSPPQPTDTLNREAGDMLSRYEEMVSNGQN